MKQDKKKGAEFPDGVGQEDGSRLEQDGNGKIGWQSRRRKNMKDSVAQDVKMA